VKTRRKKESTVTTVRKCFKILSLRDRKRILFITVIQACLSLLDLIGVALIGVLGAIAVNGISSRTAGDRTGKFLSFFHLTESSIQIQVAVLATVASIFLIGKTLFTALLSRRIAYFLSAKGANITSEMNKMVLSEDLELISSHSSMSLLYALTTGVQAVTSGIIASAVSAVADISMLFVIILGLFVVDPIIALMAFVLFGGIGLSLYVLQQKRAHKLGLESAKLNVSSSRLLVEEISAFREIFVRNKISYYENAVEISRKQLSRNIAEMSFLPSISKFVMEIAIVVSMMLIAGLQFIRTDAVHAVATLALFLAASSRFVPAILRIQQAALMIKNSLGSAQPTLDLHEKLFNLNGRDIENEKQGTSNSRSVIELENVSFKYHGNNNFAIDGLNLSIQSGQFVAFVGPSGAGKSTLVDLLLGLLTPVTGVVSILQNSTRRAIRENPGLIGYVPQSVYLKYGTIAENVALGSHSDEIDFDAVERALGQAQLSSFVAGLDLGVHTPVSEEGKTLSGGQKQRLGIARALYTDPQILVLDEATSALDGTTENEIAAEILRLRESKTVIVIAHRLSTIRMADVIHYIDKGKIIASGNFEDLKIRIPEFEKQANLMGL
jgi:ABC-type multidrug transport system fused ATPase/permease subunit